MTLNELLALKEIINKLVDDYPLADIEEINLLPDIHRSFGLYKALNEKGDEVLRWYGVPTNKFADRDGDIFTSYAHENFVSAVDAGIERFPELWIWHIEIPIGVTDWMAYDERGFLLASGYIFPEYEKLILAIVNDHVERKVPLGMSHGVPTGKYRRDKVNEKVITVYFSKEFSLLPLQDAANLLTYFNSET